MFLFLVPMYCNFPWVYFMPVLWAPWRQCIFCHSVLSVMSTPSRCPVHAFGESVNGAHESPSTAAAQVTDTLSVPMAG